MTSWPPQKLDPTKAHIIVTIGNPLTPHLQQLKLQTLLSKVLYEDEWTVQLPDTINRICCHGAMFSTTDLDKHKAELKCVQDIKSGVEKSKGKKRIIGDNQAYTNLVVVNAVGDLKEAIDNDDLINDYISKEEDELSSVKSKTSEDMIREYLNKVGSDTMLRSNTARFTMVVRQNIMDRFGLEGREWRFHKIKVDRYSGEVELVYKVIIPVGLDSLMSNDLGLHHMIWLTMEDTIDRDTYQLLMEQYEVDTHMPKKIKDMCIGMINYRYLKGERVEYGARIKLGRKRSIDSETFTELVEKMYWKHRKMIASGNCISLEEYQLLEELYKNDPVMTYQQKDTMMQVLGAQYLKWGRGGFTCENTNNPFWCGVGVGEDGAGCDECNAKWQSMSKNGTGIYKLIFGRF